MTKKEIFSLFKDLVEGETFVIDFKHLSRVKTDESVIFRSGCHLSFSPTKFCTIVDLVNLLNNALALNHWRLDWDEQFILIRDNPHTEQAHPYSPGPDGKTLPHPLAKALSLRVVPLPNPAP